ncbi:GTP-binding chloroplastic [Chlorella sorokiniana]|uniref:GTP-binding chloroplastic n=1 Tax=Chlorella sorokiniana TaxID=3076 RepID=A0A2P6TM90_CHLSO|nr:GTP-binding chloroplastic [Chlorella sorokiniana]|eukprot:PRW45451.1 GTP-binding chloroplastic [Chlorella sorokiniana]
MCIGSAARPRRPSPATFFGSGQVEAAAAHVAARQPGRVFVNALLSGVQQRNLERAWGRPVLDRVALIIEIFSQRARTAEARLQVELASLEYKASRLVRVVDASTGKRTAFGLEGDVEIVSARERGRSGSSAGGLGAGGGQGESELQLQRRRIADRRKLLLRRLEEVRKTRAVQRAARRRSGKPQVALVGYTNAGKSSLLRALSKDAEGVGVEDRLFATLDPTLRRVMLPGGRDVVLSDTVGFISDLPHALVEAFRATLEEVTEADLLLHVVDASSPHALQQRTAVLEVLRELGLSEERLQDAVIEVWNKCDQLPVADAAEEGLLDVDAAAAAYRPTAVATSVLRRQGLQQVLAAVEHKLEAQLAGRRQTSRRSAKRAGAEAWEAAEAAEQALPPASSPDDHRPAHGSAASGMTGAAGPAAALAAAGAGRLGSKPPPIVLSPEVVLHDRCNLVALPIVGGLVLAGLLGAVDTLLVTKAFILYIVADFFYILLEPKAVPSRPRVILWHHAVTFLLLQIPLKHPSLGVYTCYDGLIEWNTLFLIARRQFPRFYRQLNFLYWATFYPMRLVLFPVLLPFFWREMTSGGYAWWETAAVMGTQASLCVFNAWFLIASWRRHR